MGAVEFLVLLVIAGLSGYVASTLMGARRINILVMVALGFIGALVGRYIAGFFGLPEPLPVNIGGSSFPLVWSIGGSALVVAVVNMIRSH